MPLNLHPNDPGYYEALESHIKIQDEIFAERKRQDAKWGEQNHPSIWATVPNKTRSDREKYWKRICDNHAGSGSLCWEHIAAEEMAEALAAPTDADRRGELIQLAAVIVAWIECIDRAAAKGKIGA